MDPSQTIKVAVIIGSTRPQRFGDKPAKWFFEELKKTTAVEAELLDLRDYPLPFYEEVAPISNLDGKYASEAGRKWADKIGQFDGYIIVTPEYNHGYPAVLKNAIDYVYAEWARKPVGFISYGGVAGVRSVEQLRQVIIQLEMAPIQSSISIPEFWTRIDAAGNFKADGLEDKAKGFIEQFMWWARTLKAGRSNIH